MSATSSGPIFKEHSLIDGYAHVSLKKYLPAESLFEEMKTAGVDGAVLVQPMGEYDNGYLHSLLQRFPARIKAVGLVDPDDGEVSEKIRSMIITAGFSGIRVASSGLSNPSLLSAIEEADGALLLHLPEGIGAYLRQLVKVLEHQPRLRMFVPHLGWPCHEKLMTAGWSDAVRVLSSNTQVAAGLSAMHHFSMRPFPHEDTWNWIEHLVDMFGPERCLWGSDFPLLLEAGTYSQFVSLFREGPLPLPAEVRALVTREAAARFWRFGR